MIEIVFYISAFIISFFGVAALRGWIIKKEILDIPNERSSHETPTPRGGGLVIVGVSLGLYFVGSLFLPVTFYWSFALSAFAVALISWVDDLISVSFGWRFLIHSFAAIFVIWQLGYWQEIYVPFWGEINIGLWGSALTFCWIVWLTNAFNFMDGIDGIAGLQAVTAGVGWLIVGKMLGLETIAFVGGVIAISSLGFLLHNWEPAKIFMGDVGSAFLGFSFAAISIFPQQTVDSRIPLIAVGLVLCFALDSLFTIAKRTIKLEKIWEPHREHFYQKLVIAGKSHKIVSLGYAFVSVLFITAIIFWIS